MSAHIFSKYKVSHMPEGVSGDWSVRKFEVSRLDAEMDTLRAMINGRSRCVPAGIYTGLFQGGAVWMSDTPDEINDHLLIIYEAKRRGGKMLVQGLGLGVVTTALLRQPDVEKVTVIEINPDVIELVGPTLEKEFGDRVEIIEDDAFKWKPPKGVRYSVVWHDIWADLCTDNLKEMETLHRRYGRRCDWQGSWSKGQLQSYRRQGM